MKCLTAKPLFILLLNLVCLQQNFAQFSVDAHLRNRFEFRDGYQKLATEGSNPAAFVSQRTRLSLSYANDFLKIKLTPQDVRLWGDQANVSASGVGDNPSLDLLEAFAEIKLGNLGWVSVGRQQLSYDSRRLLGDRNWNQSGLAYDALVLKLSRNDWDLHAGASWNTMSELLSANPYPSARIKSLNFIWLNRKINERLSLSLMHISSGITQTDTTSALNFRHTTGIYGEYKTKPFNAWGNVYYQFGKNQKGNEVSALLMDAEASYKLGKFTPGIGLSYLSGNKNVVGAGITDKLFDPLYGTRHRFFGFMDYFRSFTSNTRQGGLADYYLWLDYRFTKKLSARSTFHSFSLAQTNPETPTDKELGVENDLVVKYKYSEWGELEGGYCFFLPNESLKVIQNVKNDKFSQFFYLQLTLTPNIFRQNTNSEK